MVTDKDLVARLDQNLIAYWGAYAQAAGSNLTRYEHAVFMATPIPLFLFNTVTVTGDDPASVEQALTDAGNYLERGISSVDWRISPNAADRVPQIADAGLRPGGQMPVLTIALDGEVQNDHAEGVTFQTAETADQRTEWGRLAARGFGLSPDASVAMSTCEGRIPSGLFADQPRFTGFIDGQPVATSSLVLTGEIAGIYAVATQPEARCRGMARAVTLHALAEGQRRGAKIGVLQATEMGRPIYEKIGFRQVFTYQTFSQSFSPA